MAPVYQEITMEWNGKPYNLTPTFGHIQRIEQQLGLFSLRERLFRDEYPFSQVAALLAMTLRLAGCKDDDVTDEEIFAALYDNDRRDVLFQAALKIVIALTPKMPLLGNEPAPEQGENQKPISSGAISTPLPSDTGGSSHPNSGG